MHTVSRRLFLGATASASLTGRPTRSVFVTPHSVTVPTFDRGYLLWYLDGHGVAVNGPGGEFLFRTAVPGPGGISTSVGNACARGDGTFAVAISYPAREGHESSIAILDSAGKQTALINTGQFVSCQIAYDDRGLLWAAGWNRGAGDREDRDRPVVHRYDSRGQKTGEFLPRALFPPLAAPFSCGLGLWRIRAARDRIGALAYPSQAEYRTEWVEWDFTGKLLGRFEADRRHHDGSAFTASARLFRLVEDRSAKPWRPLLVELDRSVNRWVTAPVAREDVPRAILLGADGEQLVFLGQGGTELQWFDVPA